MNKLVLTDGLLWWSEGESDRTPTKAFKVTQTDSHRWVIKEVAVPS